MARKRFAAAAALLALALALPASRALGQEAQPEPQAVQGFLYLSTPVPGLAPGAGQEARPQGGQGPAAGPGGQAQGGVAGADSSAAAAPWRPAAKGGFLAAVKSLAEKLRGLFRQGR